MPNDVLNDRKTAQVLGIIVALSISGSVFQNMALRYLSSALPEANISELAQLVTGTSGTFYKGLGSAEKYLVVVQVTAAIRDSFYYLCGVTAIGFISSLFLSVSHQALSPRFWSNVCYSNTAEEALPRKWCGCSLALFLRSRWSWD